MEALRELLVRSEPLLLFSVVGLGFLVGQIQWRNFSLGVAGVLFVGLAFGMWRPQGAPPFEISHAITEIGLILFVYAVGLTTGPGFFDSFRQRGLPFNTVIVVGLVAGAAVAVLLGRGMSLPPGQIAGIYCGGLTNTPALAAVTELLGKIDPAHAADATVGYSIAYPFGVFGALMGFQILAWMRRAPLEAERAKAAAEAHGAGKLVSRNFEIRNPELFDKAIGEVQVWHQTNLIISRLRHDGEVIVPNRYSRLREGDVIVAVGAQADIDRATDYFGAESKEHLELSREHIEMRRILVSRRELAGKTCTELDLDRRFGAQITRLRRADVEMAPRPQTVIELGDRLRVVMPRDKIAEVSRFFGDSERHLAELDYTAITLGISLGVLVGMVPISIPGGSSLSLGFAGGPLLVGLILGKVGRTGPVVWSIPLEANQTLRHIGLLFFLAGVGVTAGGRFGEAIHGSGLQLLLLGALVTSVTGAIVMVGLRLFGHATLISTLGATSGMQTQPATLARAHEMTGSDEVFVAYATTYPVAMVGKILLAQLIVVICRTMG
jgi:putative transport protein